MRSGNRSFKGWTKPKAADVPVTITMLAPKLHNNPRPLPRRPAVARSRPWLRASSVSLPTSRSSPSRQRSRLSWRWRCRRFLARDLLAGASLLAMLRAAASSNWNSSTDGSLSRACSAGATSCGAVSPDA